MSKWKAVALILGGILVGILVARPEPSSADTSQSFRECGFYCGFDFTKRNQAKLDANAKPIPPGWTVIDSAGVPNALCVLLCR